MPSEHVNVATYLLLDEIIYNEYERLICAADALPISNDNLVIGFWSMCLWAEKNT